MNSLLRPGISGIILFSTLVATLAASDGSHVRLPRSIRAIAAATDSSEAPHIVRAVLSTSENQQKLTFTISLRMRNFAELESRLQAGQGVPRAEMEARFLPLKSDYDRVVAWLVRQGFEATLVDASHTNVFARGSIATISTAFDVPFARVATHDGEFSSAIEAPAIPSEWADVVLGIEGLQPHLTLHARALQVSPDVALAQVAHPNRAIPADILAAYHAPASLDGSGQTIAIVAGAIPTASDLNAFYQGIGINKSADDLVVVPVNGGPTETSQTSSYTEAAMDVEWSSAIAPGAKVMLYATPTFSISDLMAACTRILNDGQARVVSHSASGLETSYAPATLQSYSQIFAQMAAAGITVLHGDGDNGTSGVPVYPASDPYVLGLSGTTVTFDAAWAATGEVAWTNTGGGISTVFSRPAWQAGPGVPAGTMRCVPDAASIASTITVPGTLFPYVVRNGQTAGVGGSSLTGPVWSGLVALINQARANVGLPAVGLLAARLYPLIGTNAFQDITAGGNGTYSAAPGYDLCSGVGSANVTGLVAALTTADPPSFSTAPISRTISNGATVVFSVGVTGLPAPTLQWYRDTTALAGATDAMLVLNGATAIAGNYSCLAQNSSGTVRSVAATLTTVATTDPGRLINLSIMTDVSIEAPMFTVGTVIGGGTGGTKPLLIRAVGPSLQPYGVTDALADPKLELFTGSTSLGSNDDWAGSAALVTAFNQTGAFGFVGAASKDAALFLPSAAATGYSVQISGPAGATGTALAELYDGTSANDYRPDSPRLINVSVLKKIAAGNVLTAGFVIAGSTAKTVLVRAVGPTLGQPPFGIGGTMSNPQLAVFDGAGAKIAANEDWGGSTPLADASKQVGAFAIADPTSKDAVVLLTLAPGAYSNQVRDTDQRGGLVIVEVYDVP